MQHKVVHNIGPAVCMQLLLAQDDAVLAHLPEICHILADDIV